jgi:hypothetical protein
MWMDGWVDISFFFQFLKLQTIFLAVEIIANHGQSRNKFERFRALKKDGVAFSLSQLISK